MFRRDLLPVSPRVHDNFRLHIVRLESWPGVGLYWQVCHGFLQSLQADSKIICRLARIVCSVIGLGIRCLLLITANCKLWDVNSVREGTMWQEVTSRRLYYRCAAQFPHTSSSRAAMLFLGGGNLQGHVPHVPGSSDCKMNPFRAVFLLVPDWLPRHSAVCVSCFAWSSIYEEDSIQPSCVFTSNCTCIFISSVHRAIM